MTYRNQRIDRFHQNLNGYHQRTTASQAERVPLPRPKSPKSRHLWIPCSCWALRTDRRHRHLYLHHDHHQWCCRGRHNSVVLKWSRTSADAIATENTGQQPPGTWTSPSQISTATSSMTFSQHLHEIHTSVFSKKVAQKENNSELWKFGISSVSYFATLSRRFESRVLEPVITLSLEKMFFIYIGNPYILSRVSKSFLSLTEYWRF